MKSRSTIWASLDKEYQCYRREVCSKKTEEKLAAFIQYREKTDTLFECLKSNAILDQGQAEFLSDQSGPREKCLMEYLLAIDITNTAMPPPEIEEMEVGDAGIGELNEDESCRSHVESEEEEQIEEEGHLYFGLRSGKRLKASLESEESGSGSEDNGADKIRIGPKLFSKRCVEAIIAMNTQAHITINQARSCFLLVENIFHGKTLRLKPEQTTGNVPRSAEDYKAYENVVPSEAVVWNYRHKYALCKLDLIFSLVNVPYKRSRWVTLKALRNRALYGIPK